MRYGKNAYGYCSATYISEQSSSKAASVSVSSGSYLNVRSGAGINYAAKDKLYRGDQVVILTSYSNGFCKVLYNGKNIGYVSGNYLTASNAISLAVPLYRQFDTRWASITLGSTKKTMASIGCTTTSLAMTESFRTGTTITPAMMEARLSYTASGHFTGRPTMWWANLRLPSTTPTCSSWASRSLWVARTHTAQPTGLWSPA